MFFVQFIQSAYKLFYSIFENWFVCVTWQGTCVPGNGGCYCILVRCPYRVRQVALTGRGFPLEEQTDSGDGDVNPTLTGDLYSVHSSQDLFNLLVVQKKWLKLKTSNWVYQLKCHCKTCPLLGIWHLNSTIQQILIFTSPPPTSKENQLRL